MALVSCPSCGLHRTAADADRSPCPVCGLRPGDTAPPPEEVAAAPRPAPPPREPDPEPEPADRRNVWLVGGLVVAGLGVLAAMVALRPDDPPPPAAPPPPVEVADEDTRPAAPPAHEPPVAPPPRRVTRSAEPPPVEPVTIPVPVPVPQPVAGPSVIRLNRPKEDFRLDRLADKNHVKLVGRVGKLVLDGLDGGAALDATELSVDVVSIYGPITGGSTLALKSAECHVTFRATSRIDGGSTVRLDLGAGSLTFSSAASPSIRVTGGSRLTVTARTILIGGIVSGPGTAVDLTLFPPGVLKFTGMDAGAKMQYRLQHPGDILPKVTPGEVKGEAEFRRVK